MAETDILAAGDPMPRIGAVSTDERFQINVSWSKGLRAGKSEIVDLAPEIFKFKIYAPLRDNRILFRSIHIEHSGSAVAWGDGDIDMAADTIEDLAAQAMTSSDFKAFMARQGWTLDATAAQLGVSRRQIAYFATSKTVPRTVALACKWLEGVARGKQAAITPQKAATTVPQSTSIATSTLP